MDDRMDFDWRQELPEAWVALIEADEVLRELFEECATEEEPVPAYLIQDLRGGELERLRPICGLYGHAGEELLGRLLAIEAASRETARHETPEGTAYAAYFFCRYKGEAAAAEAAAREYTREVRRFYEQDLEEEAPVAAEPRIEILTGEAAAVLEKEMRRAWDDDSVPDGLICDDLVDWGSDLAYALGEELAELLREPLYHISNDYLLAYYVLWPLTGRQDEPFGPYFELWRLGLGVHFVAADKVVLTA